MNELLTLIKRVPGVDADGNPTTKESSRTVFCGLRSITRSEFYQANATDFRPEVTFVLADYLEYSGETLAEHNGQRYRILRTYRTGQELELVAERAPAEDGGVRG